MKKLSKDFLKLSSAELASLALPIYECILTEIPKGEDEEERPFDPNYTSIIVVSRKIDNNTLWVANALIDKFCTGLKDGFLEILPLSEYNQMVDHFEQQMIVYRIEVTEAKKMIYDSVDYAESIGIKPNKVLREIGIMFQDIDSSVCNKIFSFGLNGRPTYIPFLQDEDSLRKKIIKALTKKVGADGFDVIYQEDFMNQEEIDELLDDEFDDEFDDQDEDAVMDAMQTHLDTFEKFTDFVELSLSVLKSEKNTKSDEFKFFRDLSKDPKLRKVMYDEIRNFAKQNSLKDVGNVVKFNNE
ncbi:MAG: hypothetical protein NT007_08180 [Candidatus Kapabacteria bacterium]|nr:hypothetical protein [Candidatus Kapabacteria bacterium]